MWLGGVGRITGDEDGGDASMALFVSPLLNANDFNSLITSWGAFFRDRMERSDVQMLGGELQLLMLFFFSGNHRD